MITPDPPAIRIRVPASTSNLGPGFDVLGLAVDRGVEVVFHPGSPPGPGPDTGLRIHRRGSLEGLDLPPNRDLVVAAARERLGRDLRGVLEMTSDIPVGRGLGSSAAARTAGAILGALLSGDEPDREAVALAVSRAEGHPDNAVPAVMGGLVAARLHPGGLEWIRLPLSPRLALVYAAPEVPLDTEAARDALPATVAHADAVANAARLPLLLDALARGDGEAVGRNLEDRLHVPYRIPLIPGAADCRAAGLHAGAFGVTLSGAGSGLLAVAPPEQAAEVQEAMRQALVRATGGAVAFPLVVDQDGARWG